MYLNIFIISNNSKTLTKLNDNIPHTCNIYKTVHTAILLF